MCRNYVVKGNKQNLYFVMKYHFLPFTVFFEKKADMIDLDSSEYGGLTNLAKKRIFLNEKHFSVNEIFSILRMKWKSYIFFFHKLIVKLQLNNFRTFSFKILHFGFDLFNVLKQK